MAVAKMTLPPWLHSSGLKTPVVLVNLVAPPQVQLLVLDISAVRLARCHRYNRVVGLA